VGDLEGRVKTLSAALEETRTQVWALCVYEGSALEEKDRAAASGCTVWVLWMYCTVLHCCYRLTRRIQYLPYTLSQN
jgi:hypothetical protein